MMNVCGPDGEPQCIRMCVGACVHACVSVCVQQENGQITQVSKCMLSTVSFLLSVQWVPAQPLVVGWLALRLSACEFGSAGAGLHFVMRSERMAGAMREMGFEGELLVSGGFWVI
jgi:hypothetical protein